MTALLKTIPRTVVLATLEGIRLPLTTVERLTGQASNATWAPTMLFEDFEANALQFVGGVLRDDELVDQGRLQAAKVTELRRATELEAKAEQTRREADAKLERDRVAAKKERARVEQQARAREADAERKIRQAESALDEDARAAEADIEATAQQREQSVAAAERTARLKAADAESKALSRQQAAISATERAAGLDEKLDAKKQQRKNS